MNRTLVALALAGSAFLSPAMAGDAPGGGLTGPGPEPVNTVPEPGSAALALLALGAGVAQRVRAARRRNEASRRD